MFNKNKELVAAYASMMERMFDILDRNDVRTESDRAAFNVLRSLDLSVEHFVELMQFSADSLRRHLAGGDDITFDVAYDFMLEFHAFMDTMPVRNDDVQDGSRMMEIGILVESSIASAELKGRDCDTLRKLHESFPYDTVVEKGTPAYEELSAIFRECGISYSDADMSEDDKRKVRWKFCHDLEAFLGKYRCPEVPLWN